MGIDRLTRSEAFKLPTKRKPKNQGVQEPAEQGSPKKPRLRPKETDKQRELRLLADLTGARSREAAKDSGEFDVAYGSKDFNLNFLDGWDVKELFKTNKKQSKAPIDPSLAANNLNNFLNFIYDHLALREPITPEINFSAKYGTRFEDLKTLINSHLNEPNKVKLRTSLTVGHLFIKELIEFSKKTLGAISDKSSLNREYASCSREKDGQEPFNKSRVLNTLELNSVTNFQMKTLALILMGIKLGYLKFDTRTQKVLVA